MIYAVLLCNKEWNIVKIKQNVSGLSLKPGDCLADVVQDADELTENDEKQYSLFLTFRENGMTLSTLVRSFQEGNLVILSHVRSDADFVEFNNEYLDFVEWVENHLEGFYHSEYFQIQKLNNQLIDSQRALIRSKRNLEMALEENKKINRKISEARQAAEQASRSKTQFLANMSHDIRTPMNGIIGMLNIADRYVDNPDEVKKYHQKIRMASEYLLSLINDTLELSKLENEETKLPEEDFYLPELLHEVETIAQMRADKECITIHFMEDPYSIPYPNLTGSSLHVKQIFLNLITNSIKYNRKNGSVDCFLKEEKQSDNRVLVDVTIKDTGIGMSEDFLKNIFQPFVQADQGARSQYKGTGLGMAIVKELLDRMGGTIQIDSMENQGTTIHVVIPFEIAEEPAAVQEMSELPKESLSGCRILLAEDNELNREIAVFLLKDEGISVTEAEEGQQAVECFLKMPEGYYDAVLMDIMMPVMDGYQAARAIRGSGKKDAEMIPIIAMTANTFAEDKRKTMEAGMDAHLSKPINVPELMDTIRKFCAGKKMCQ